MPIKSDIVHTLSKRFPQLTIGDVNLSINVILNEIGNALQQGRKQSLENLVYLLQRRKLQEIQEIQKQARC